MGLKCDNITRTSYKITVCFDSIPALETVWG
jgi:hypothetical protein